MKVKKEYVKEARLLLRYYYRWQNKWHRMINKVASIESQGDYSSQQFDRIGCSGGSGYSDPVSRYYQRLERLTTARKYALARIQPAIEEVLSIKNSPLENEREMFLILERHFDEGESIEDIAQSLGKSSRTLYRRKGELVLRVAQRVMEAQ